MSKNEKENFRNLLWSKELDPLFDALREERTVWERLNLGNRELLVAVSLFSYIFKKDKAVNVAARELFTQIKERHDNNLNPEDVEVRLAKVIRDLPEWVKPALEAALSIGAESHRSEIATKAASARHAENHSLKQQALQYYDEHAKEFRSMNAAAAAICAKVVPVGHRTVYEWIRQHRKQLRSASKP